MPSQREYSTILCLALVGLLLALAHAGRGADEVVADGPDFAALNEAFGIAVWGDDNLWDDADEDVAGRLRWPRESRTSTQSSFRRYALRGAPAAGAKAYSMALYAEDSKPTYISIIFNNKGDFAASYVTANLAAKVRAPTSSDVRRLHREAERKLKAAIEADAKAIEAKLSAVLGRPRRDRFGQGKAMRETVDRWDWQGHAILLATPRREYVGLRILPTAVADREGKAEKVSDVEMKKILAKRVAQRPNGDVIISEIPMVNQGPKGFCVPATWERYLRYMGIPADMYTLAMAGDTQFGGGTSANDMGAGARTLIRRHGRRLKPVGASVNISSVAKQLDRGLPIMWSMYVVAELSRQLTGRSRRRQGFDDPKAWNAELKEVRKAARRIKIDRSQGHICMIIGYNKTTNELAISDSWGAAFAERWITVEEAKRITKGDLLVIKW